MIEVVRPERTNYETPKISCYSGIDVHVSTSRYRHIYSCVVRCGVVKNE